VIALLCPRYKKYEEIDSLLLEFAKKASEFNMWFENAEEDLSDPVHNQLNSLDEIAAEKAKFQDFLHEYGREKVKFGDVVMLSRRITTLQGADTSVKNPYTWFDVGALERFWESLDAVITDREDDLDREQSRQEGNENLRLLFAKQVHISSAACSPNWLSLICRSLDVRSLACMLQRLLHSFHCDAY
jgi:hypothetical protein